MGWLADKYLLVEDDDGLLVVDAEALRRTQRRAAPITSRALVPPKILRVERAPDGLGFEVESFSDGEIAVKAVPAFLRDADVEPCLRALAKSDDPRDVLARFDDTPANLDDIHGGFRVSFHELEKHFSRSSS